MPGSLAHLLQHFTHSSPAVPGAALGSEQKGELQGEEGAEGRSACPALREGAHNFTELPHCLGRVSQEILIKPAKLLGRAAQCHKMSRLSWNLSRPFFCLLSLLKEFSGPSTSLKRYPCVTTTSYRLYV